MSNLTFEQFLQDLERRGLYPFVIEGDLFFAGPAESVTPDDEALAHYWLPQLEAQTLNIMKPGVEDSHFIVTQYFQTRITKLRQEISETLALLPDYQVEAAKAIKQRDLLAQIRIGAKMQQAETRLTELDGDIRLLYLELDIVEGQKR